MSWSSLGTTSNSWNGYPPRVEEYTPILSFTSGVLKKGLELTENQTKSKSYNHDSPQKKGIERGRDIHSMCFVPLNPLAPCFIPSLTLPNTNFDQVLTTNAPNDLDYYIASTREMGVISDAEKSAASFANSAPNRDIEVENAKECDGENDNSFFAAGLDSDLHATSFPILNPLAACFITQETAPSFLKAYGNDDTLDITPPLCDIDTPNTSLVKSPEGIESAELQQLDPSATPYVPLLVNFSFDESLTGNVSSLEDIDDPQSILKDLKEKNLDRPVIAHLNINSVSSKFEPLMSMIKENLDFLLVTESKLDDTFPMGQFQVEGFSRPIRLDRNRDGGGIIIFIRDD